MAKRSGCAWLTKKDRRRFAGLGCKWGSSGFYPSAFLVVEMMTAAIL